MERKKDGTFGKGNSGKQKGTCNKVTIAVKEKFKQLMDDYDIEQMKEDLRSLEPSERLKIVSTLSNYLIPKQTHNINEQKEPPNLVFENVSTNYNFDKDGNIIKK